MAKSPVGDADPNYILILSRNQQTVMKAGSLSNGDWSGWIEWMSVIERVVRMEEPWKGGELDQRKGKKGRMSELLEWILIHSVKMQRRGCYFPPRGTLSLILPRYFLLSPISIKSRFFSCTSDLIFIIATIKLRPIMNITAHLAHHSGHTLMLSTHCGGSPSNTEQPITKAKE